MKSSKAPFTLSREVGSLVVLSRKTLRWIVLSDWVELTTADAIELVTDESKRKYQVAINSARFKIDNFRKRLAKVYSDIEITAKQIIELQNNNESTVNLQTKLKTLQDKQISLQTLIEEQESFISDLKKSRETNSLIVFFDMAERELEQLKTLSEKSELTADEIDQAERIYSLWSAVGDRTLNRNTNSHPIFTKKELENDEMEAVQCNVQSHNIHLALNESIL